MFIIEHIVTHYNPTTGLCCSLAADRERVQHKVGSKLEIQTLLAQLDHKRAKGRAVIVRPTWNEDGYFYEYRSIDGEPFRYVRFDTSAAKG